MFKFEMMEQEEVEERIKHVKRNLLFFSVYWDELSKTPKSKQTMYNTIDYLLDELIELLKLRK